MLSSMLGSRLAMMRWYGRRSGAHFRRQKYPGYRTRGQNDFGFVQGRPARRRPPRVRRLDNRRPLHVAIDEERKRVSRVAREAQDCWEVAGMHTRLAAQGERIDISEPQPPTGGAV